MADTSTQEIAPSALALRAIAVVLVRVCPSISASGRADRADDPRTTMRYDRGRQSLDRHATSWKSQRLPVEPLAGITEIGHPPLGRTPDTGWEAWEGVH